MLSFILTVTVLSIKADLLKQALNVESKRQTSHGTCLTSDDRETGMLSGQVLTVNQMLTVKVTGLAEWFMPVLKRAR